MHRGWWLVPDFARRKYSYLESPKQAHQDKFVTIGISAPEKFMLKTKYRIQRVPGIRSGGSGGMMPVDGICAKSKMKKPTHDTEYRWTRLHRARGFVRGVLRMGIVESEKKFLGPQGWRDDEARQGGFPDLARWYGDPALDHGTSRDCLRAEYTVVFLRFYNLRGNVIVCHGNRFSAYPT